MYNVDERQNRRTVFSFNLFRISESLVRLSTLHYENVIIDYTLVVQK